jgi:hypothetical protein
VIQQNKSEDNAQIGMAPRSSQEIELFPANGRVLALKFLEE